MSVKALLNNFFINCYFYNCGYLCSNTSGFKAVAFEKRQMKFTLVYLSHYYTISSKVRRKAGKYNMVATRFAHQIAEYFSPFLAKIK